MQNIPGLHTPSRRNLIKSAAAGLTAASIAAAGLFPLTAASRALAAPTPATIPAAETLVAQLFKSLNEEQKTQVAFPFDHPLRSEVDNNWFIVKKRIGETFNKDQQALIREIFRDIHSEEYAKQVLQQVEHDNKEDGGFDSCAVALFGQPPAPGAADTAPSKFEFVFTGRHVTRRCDGNSVDGAAFGGPIFYGHAAHGFNEKADHPDNIYWYQGLRPNEVFKALDGKQRDVALRSDPRDEKGSKTVALSGKKNGLPGIGMTDLSADQKGLVRKVMSDLLAPFRKTDADEAMKLIEDGGFDNLHMAFYKNNDIGNDGVWDVWQIEGPSMIWYFRGAPHIHTWVHIREPEKA